MEYAPSSPTSLLNLLASTSQQIEFFSSSIINEVKNGHESPLKVLIQLRAMEKSSKQILDAIKNEILTAADKYPGKEFELWGNRLSKEEVGVKYDYSHSKDTVWESLNTDLETTEAKLRERQEFLKTLRGPLHVVDELTGEIVTICPPKKTSTTSLKVFIK